MCQGLTCCFVEVGVWVGADSCACEPEADVCFDAESVFEDALYKGCHSVVDAGNMSADQTARLTKIGIRSVCLDKLFKFSYRAA